MSERRTVTINGQHYDAVTGLPVKDAPAQPRRAAAATPSVTHLHSKTQRSTTLNRQFTKRPAPARTAITTHHAKTTPAHANDIHRPLQHKTHAQVRRFAPHPIGATKSMDVGPLTHPHVAKAHALSAAKARGAAHTQTSAAPHATASAIKNESITKAVEAAKPTAKPHKTKFWQQRQRVTGIVAATFALVLLGSYFTYLNMPSLSVKVAAAQAGIDATYPDYRPDGYALNGPVTYSDGRVSMNFKANGSDASFSVNQSKSRWNSEAVLDNYVTPRAGSSYIPYAERGLTIYTYDNSAAWVNGGILYTIEGDAPLSGDQIRRIATSLL